MWRLITLASLLLTLALGTIAEGKCQVCVESVKAERADGGMSLRFTARAVHAPALPETGTAVVMQVDGNRSKCINVALRKVDETGGVATYAGSLTSFYGNSTFTGRVDIAGDIHEFTAPLDGKPGTFQLVTAATAGQVTSTATTAPSTAPSTAPTTVPLTAGGVPTAVPQSGPTAPTAEPIATAEPVATAEPQTAATAGIPSPLQQPVAWLGLVVILATAVGAYFDRKRALARATMA